MQTDDNTVHSDDSAMGFHLADMQQIGWEQALREKQAILRLASPSESQLQAIKKRFSLDELHIRDICNPLHPPYFTRLENGAVHIILRFPVDREHVDDISDVTSVSILADDEMCALIWPGRRHHLFSEQDLIGLNVSECVCKIIHMLVDYLLKRTYLLREDMEEFEDECLADVTDADLGRLLLMRKELSTLARHARTNAMAIDKLRTAGGTYRDNLRLIDAHEHMQRASAIAESRAEHALNVMQAVQSLLSQRLNEVMKFLAVITVVLTPMGIIAGIFGMNFTKMDVLAYPHGFMFSIWAMLVLGGALAIFFKIRKWW